MIYISLKLALHSNTLINVDGASPLLPGIENSKFLKACALFRFSDLVTALLRAHFGT